MDITIIGTTSGVPYENLLTWLSVNVTCENWIKKGFRRFNLIPRDMEYTVLEKHENPNWPRTSFKVVMKDVCQEGDEDGVLPSKEHVDENDFIELLEQNRCIYLMPTWKENSNVQYWAKAIVIGDKIVGGNDISVLWDSENHRWDVNKI